MTGTFPISLEKAHKSAYRLQQWRLLLVVTLGSGNMESYGGNQIIVLIVHIVTLFLNEAKSFSLFNATQFLSIPIRENLAGVFIVLIVHSVTHCLNEAMPFSLFNATQILSIAIGKAQGINLAVVFIDLIVTPIPALFCCQKIINYAGRTHLIFTNR